MLNDKQKLLLKNLKNIKDYWTNSAVEHLRPNADFIASNCEEEYLLLSNKLYSDKDLIAFQKYKMKL
jgi:hypothetical protein